MEKARTEELVRVHATQTPAKVQYVTWGEAVWSLQLDKVRKEQQGLCCSLSGCGLEVGVL